MTKIITFYSFKGGVGRTMALVNVAHVMARDGWRVLLVDLDLEAPGMTHFLARKSDRRRKSADRDVVDLLLQVKENITADSDEAQDIVTDLSEYIINITIPEDWQSSRKPTPYRAGRLDLIPATLESDAAESRDYLTRIGELNLAWIFSESGPGHKFGKQLRAYLLGARFETRGDSLFACRDPLLASYDVILLDSRTGLNEIAGLCVGPVSDSIVVCTGLNAQNLAGTRYFARRVGLLNKEVGKPFTVVVSPVPMWHSTRSSKRIGEIAKALNVDPDTIVEIPYHPSAALAEMIFVVEEPKDHITRAYEQLAPRLTGGMADEREQRRMIKRIDQVSGDGADVARAAADIARHLSSVRLQDRPKWLRPRTITFPTGFTLRGLPRRNGLSGIEDSARLALAAGVASTKLRSNEPFKLAADLLSEFEPDAGHDLRFRLLYYELRIRGSLPSKQRLGEIIRSITTVLSQEREVPISYSHELAAVLRIDAIVAGMLLRGAEYEDEKLPTEGQLRALLLPALEAQAYSPISGVRRWLRASRISAASIIDRYSTFLSYLFKSSLPPDEKQLVRKAVEELRVDRGSGRRLPGPPTHYEVSEYVDDRRLDVMPLGMAPEIVMISSLALALTSPNVTEVLGWIDYARAINGYSWRALVDWRHLEGLMLSPTIVKYMRDEDATADYIERRIDTGVYAL